MLTSTIAFIISGNPGAKAEGGFDGSWMTIIACPVSFDGAAAYTLRFAATVKGGTFHGEYGVRGKAGYLTLDGKIMPDGTATLLGQGLTGNPTYVIGHPGKTMPFSYHVQSHFGDREGRGTRVELRPCESAFTKQ
jgi:hypothetical protein